MEIKITIALDERAHETLNRLADALSKEVKLTVATPGTEAPVEDSKATHGKNAKKAPVSAEEPKVGEVPTETPEEPTEATSEGVDDEKPVPLEELRALAADVKASKGSHQPLKDLLNEFKAAKLSEVPAEKTAAFAKRLKELL